MNKLKATMRDIKNSNYIVLGVGYCDLQATLNYESPEYYATRAEGWACDCYRINERYSIVTGYSTQRSSTTHANDYYGLNEAMRTLEQKVLSENMTREERKQALINLLDDYLDS